MSTRSTHAPADPALAPDDGRPQPPRKPPKWLFHYVMNPLMRTALRTPLGARRLGGVLALLSFTGHRTGRRYTIPVGFHRQGETLAMFTHSPWWRNFQQGAAVAVRLGGKTVPGWAEATRDPDLITAAFQAMLRQRGARAGRPFGIQPSPGQELAPGELRARLQSQGVVLVTVRLGSAAHPT